MTRRREFFFTGYTGEQQFCSSFASAHCRFSFPIFIKRIVESFQKKHIPAHSSESRSCKFEQQYRIMEIRQSSVCSYNLGYRKRISVPQ